MESRECQICRSTNPIALHNTPHRGVFALLCTPCVLRHHPGAFCPICFDAYEDTTTTNRTMCHRCPALAHRNCLPSTPSFNYLCPHCSDPSFSYSDYAASTPIGFTRDFAKQLLCAAKISASSAHRAAAMARADAEQKVRGALMARQKAKEAIERVADLVANQQTQEESEETERDRYWKTRRRSLRCQSTLSTKPSMPYIYHRSLSPSLITTPLYPYQQLIMEGDSEPGRTMSPSQIKAGKLKGGFTATSFIYALAALENMGFVAMMLSMGLYFTERLYFDLPGAANTLTNLMGSTFLLTTLGAFISDTYIDRFHTTLIFGVLEVLALVMMTIQAHTTSLLPASPCPLGTSTCIDGGKAVFFYTSLCLLALGAGAMRGALPALGADQFDEKDPKEAKGLASYFNWLLLSIVGGAAFGVTFVVWVATNKNNHNWWKGFLITTVAAIVGFAILALGKSFYRLQVLGESPLVRIAQVIVAAAKNSGLPHPESPSELYEVNEKDSESTLAHTQQFRWLDKAAIASPNGAEEPSSNLKVCTVTQVEEVKVLIRMMPIIASTIVMNTCLAQLQTFSVQQGYIMDPYLGSFKVPAASVPVIPILFMILLIPLYEFFFVPFARRFTNNPTGITQLQRVGVGLVLSAVSMAVAALVEVKRRHQSINTHRLEPISLFWLSFQYGIFGIADMFTLVGLLEFFYREAPQGMKSLSTSFTFISLSLGYFLSSVLVDVVNSITRRVTPSKQGWLHGLDLDNNNLNLFYWLLAILSVLNFFHYLYWAMWYKYKKSDDKIVVAKNGIPVSQSISAVPFLEAAAAEEGAAKGESTDDKVVG